ncbi:hypothetical protein GCM10027020_30660 [Nocardioides salsibiostraticola]
MQRDGAFQDLVVGTPESPAPGFGEQVHEPIATGEHVAGSNRLSHTGPLDGLALWDHCKRIDRWLGEQTADVSPFDPGLIDAGVQEGGR